MDIEKIKADVLIVGGGAAGCYAAFTLAEDNPQLKIILVDKANIKRSGCLAAGVNALNAYITSGQTPEDYVDYANKDASGIVREDLLLSMAEGLNRVTEKIEKLGLIILKDCQGNYMTRGLRNIKINGENIKTILANQVEKYENIKVLNHVNVFDYIKKQECIKGAYGVSVLDEKFYIINSKAVICATGGAAGLYMPNNATFSRHKIWYSPFNTGAGYAMGVRAGAEMTTFEMRFIALRCKDTISPTGTLAQGIGAEQINVNGEYFQHKYGNTTFERVYGVISENMAGRGPCYLKTTGIDKAEEELLYKAYLNMSPAQTLKWIERGRGPSEENVEIEGTEPYIVGGHTASGYWIDCNRRTSLEGLYAAGDVAGGCPQKYVTGAFVEGELAAKAVAQYVENAPQISNDDSINKIKYEEILQFFNNTEQLYSVDELEEAMQKNMDKYAGGISVNYRYNEKQLKIAQEKIRRIFELSKSLLAKNMYDLLKILELRERLLICLTLLEHLLARKETRWPGFAENTDYPDKNSLFEKYINSKVEDGVVKIIIRDLIKRGECYEHKN